MTQISSGITASSGIASGIAWILTTADHSSTSHLPHFLPENNLWEEHGQQATEKDIKYLELALQ